MNQTFDVTIYIAHKTVRVKAANVATAKRRAIESLTQQEQNKALNLNKHKVVRVYT